MLSAAAARLHTARVCRCFPGQSCSWLPTCASGTTAWCCWTRCTSTLCSQARAHDVHAPIVPTAGAHDVLVLVAPYGVCFVLGCCQLQPLHAVSGWPHALCVWLHRGPSCHSRAGCPAGTQHVSLRSLPGMAHRCLRIGSAGKTFSFTAWKVGSANVNGWRLLFCHWASCAAWAPQVDAQARASNQRQSCSRKVWHASTTTGGSPHALPPRSVRRWAGCQAQPT